jgi:molybdate transport system ATP-binding protein
MQTYNRDASDEAAAPVVSFTDANFSRRGGDILFHKLTWTVREGETWAVVGPVGAGKTTLAEVLLGRHRLNGGSLAWPLLDRLRGAGRAVTFPAEILKRVSFRDAAGPFDFSRHYYQQRFNFVEPHDDLRVDAFLRSGNQATDADVDAVVERLGLEALRTLSLIQLSSGQNRRARIARALLARPEWLLLDEPFLGLDVAGRSEVADLLGELIRGGLRVLLITRGDLPDWVTHVLELDRLAVRWQGTRADFALQRCRRSTCGDAARAAEPELFPDLLSPPVRVPAVDAPPILELRGVHVSYGERAILRDVSWTVRAGERWAVLGPNGSGKSTLLALLCGDHPQAYANDLWLFGRKRGSGESIWDIKRHIGMVSAELHLYFSEPLTAFQTAATGFSDVLARRPTTLAQDALVRSLFDEFGLTDLGERPFARLSLGEQRLVLLLRALVKRPPLLILDEPFQAIDTRLIARVRDWLDHRLGPDQTLLFVSHHSEEIPRTVDRRLRLAEGRVVEQV